MQDDLLKNKKSYSTLNQAEEEVTSQLLLGLTLFSSVLFVFSALILRFLLTLQTAVFLWIFSIHFQYRLLDIQFSTIDSTKWPYLKIVLVFGLGYLVLSFAGIFLLIALKKIHRIPWKIKLFLTWMAFLLVHALPAGLLAGILFFNGFGIAFQWTVSSILVRSMTGVVVLGIMVLFRNSWAKLFLKTCPNSAFLKNDKYKSWYIKHVFFISWIIGYVFLLAYNKPLLNGYWPVFFLSIGIVATPLFLQSEFNTSSSVRKSETIIFKSLYPVLFLLCILVLAWLARYGRIDF